MNYAAVIVAAIIIFAIGFLWYGPLFGRRWMALMNVTPSGVTTANMVKTSLSSFILALVMSYVLALVVGWTGATSAGTGAWAGFLVWLGFIGTVMYNSVLYERRPLALYVLNTAYYLIALLIAGALLAVWT